MLAYTDDVALIAENREEDLTVCAEQLLIDVSLSSTAQGQWGVPTWKHDEEWRTHIKTSEL